MTALLPTRIAFRHKGAIYRGTELVGSIKRAGRQYALELSAPCELTTLHRSARDAKDAAVEALTARVAA